jgi:hypothetical protein
MMQQLPEEGRKYTCYICTEEYDICDVHEHQLVSPPCLHAACKTCLTRWVLQHESCPVCKARTVVNDLRDTYTIVNVMVNLSGILDKENHDLHIQKNTIGLHIILTNDEYTNQSAEIRRTAAIIGQDGDDTRKQYVDTIQATFRENKKNMGRGQRKVARRKAFKKIMCIERVQYNRCMRTDHLWQELHALHKLSVDAIESIRTQQITIDSHQNKIALFTSVYS